MLIFVLVITILVALDLAAARFGVDSRDRDDHYRHPRPTSRFR